MAENTFTPGPWAYRPEEFDDWGFVRAPKGGIICQAYDPEKRDNSILAIHRAEGTDPWEANARLIASAPDLLEALEEATAELEAFVGDYRDHSGAAAITRARSAIARARGDA